MSRILLKYKKAMWIVILGISSFLISSQTFSDSEAPPSDFSKVTKNKQYIFVMLSPWGNHTLKYKQSGLYENNGTQVPEWTVDWYSYGVLPNSDGKHLIRFGPWASHVSGEALSFFKDGKLSKYYKIKDLIKDESKLKHSVSHFTWQEKSRYFEEEGVIYLKTLDSNTYIFSIYSGDRLTSDSNEYKKIIEKVKQLNFIEKEKIKKEREKGLITETVALDEGVKLIARDIIGRLPMQFTIEDAEKLSNSLIQGEKDTKSAVWKKVVPLITSSNRLIEKNINGKKYYQKK